MPRPVYMLGADGLSQDKQTNRLSVFQVTEVVVCQLDAAMPKSADEEHVLALASGSGLHPLTHIVVVWMGIDGDFDREFEQDIHVEFADGRKHGMMDGATPVRFNHEKPLNRTIYAVHNMPVPDETGIVDVVARIWPAGTREAVEQRFPLIVRVEQADNQRPEVET